MTKAKNIKLGDNSLNAEQLRNYLDRVEKLEDEKAGLSADIRDIYAEAKGNGYDTKAMRKVLRLKRMDAQARDEELAMVELYSRAIDILN